MFSVAPMMDWTDRHCRAFHRVLTRHARLYTEMVTAQAVLHGPRERLLAFDVSEHPVALQLGGSVPGDLAKAAAIGAEMGFDEINLNVGCPSDRVQSGRFGACLMKEPMLVAECVAAMRGAVQVPVTVKCRIGVDDQDPEETLFAFADQIAATGVSTLIVHARKAWLKGLSPKENREVPPLNHALVHRLKAARPDMTIVINGGIASLEDAKAHLGHVDGVMMGRAAYQDPFLLAGVDAAFFGVRNQVSSREAAIALYRPYMARQLDQGVPLSAMTRHMLGLYNGLPGARSFRRVLSTEAVKPSAGLSVLDAALMTVCAQAQREAA